MDAPTQGRFLTFWGAAPEFANTDGPWPFLVVDAEKGPDDVWRCSGYVFTDWPAVQFQRLVALVEHAPPHEERASHDHVVTWPVRT